jgi:TPP-dependent pyruvate/acetoin dehydrogenase alpha subunit
MNVAEVTQEAGYELYRRMFLIRSFERKAYDLYLQGKVLGAMHSSIGQEAVAAGVTMHLRADDYITSNHRGHGHSLAKGARPDKMLAELLGREDGYCRGKGGSMHVADVSIGVLGANGIVAAGLPIAVGAGLSAQLRGSDQVSVAFFGDGAAQEGAFHEALNWAAVWRLPVVFVCENNLYAVSVPLTKATLVQDIAVRAAGYGMPGAIADGMDALSVYQKAGEAVARARRGEGPSLVECKTYRYMGHSRGDPGVGVYRTKAEVEEWEAKDPIPRLVRSLSLDTTRISELEAGIAREIDQAVAFAEASPQPLPEEALEDVFGVGGR